MQVKDLDANTMVDAEVKDVDMGATAFHFIYHHTFRMI